MSIYDKASLVLIPSGTKTSKVYSQKPVNGDGDFTFSRSTAATRVNADGNIEKETQNLLRQSNTFSVTWQKVTGSIVTSGQSGYDGSNDAWLLEKPNTGNGTYLNQNISFSGLNTFSVYAKANTSPYIAMFCNGAFGGQYFDLINGVLGNTFLGSPATASITSVGGGWYRCSITLNGAISDARIYAADVNSITPIGDVYIQDAQLEQGLVARDYIETTTAAVEGGITDNVPRLDYTDSSCPALLLEPQRTNLLTHSEYFGASYWTKSGASVVGGFTSPEGLGNAYKLVEGTNNGSHQIYSSFFSGSAGNNYTTSFFVKAGERTWCRIMNYGGAVVFFDLANGVKGTESNATGSIEPLADGWYKISSTYSSQSNERAYLHIAESNNTTSYQGNGSSGIYVFGAQAELGSYATSYIPTYGTSVTRAEDDVRKTSISSLLNATEGTLFVEYAQTLPVTTVILQLSTGNNNNRVQIENQAGGKPLIVATSDGVTQAVKVNPTAIPLNEVRKVAFTYRDSEFKMFVNGEFTGAELTGVTPTSLTAAYIGSEAGLSYIGFKLNQALVFKNALSDAEAIALTTI